MNTQEVAAQCSQDWQQLRRVQAELQNVEPSSVSREEPLLHILAEREKRLKAELKDLKERQLSRVPQNKDMQLLLLEQEEQKSLAEYRETLAFLRAKREDTIAALKKSEAEGVQLLQLNEELKKKASALQQRETNESSSDTLDTVLTEMRDKKAKISETERYFSRALKNLLANKCPAPDPAQVRKTLNESQDVDPSRVLDTKRMVGRLIEQALNSPEQPYIELGNRAWPAQVEFLLRCQIAVQHPDDPRRIKLVPFHL